MWGEGGEKNHGEEEMTTSAAVPAASWHLRLELLEDCLVGEGRLLVELVGMVDEHGGRRFDGASVQLSGHKFRVLSLCALGDGWVASGSADSTIRIWDLNKKSECVQTLTGHTDWVFSVFLVQGSGGIRLSGHYHSQLGLEEGRRVCADADWTQ